MVGNNRFDIDELVEPDRVHRACYADEDIFEREIRQIFNKSWIYVGHESQIPKSGDYATTVIGRQPVIMVRHQDRSIHVLYNRCPHRGALMCNQKSGNTGSVFTCSYHSWQYKLDGKVRHIPIQDGYDNTRFSLEDPNFHMKPVARMEIYRGFVFSSLSLGGPNLKSWLGNAIAGIDDMCDRAPEGEVEVVPTCFRMIQKYRRHPLSDLSDRGFLRRRDGPYRCPEDADPRRLDQRCRLRRHGFRRWFLERHVLPYPSGSGPGLDFHAWRQGPRRPDGRRQQY